VGDFEQGFGSRGDAHDTLLVGGFSLLDENEHP
jgi:hypothetical protein